MNNIQKILAAEVRRLKACTSISDFERCEAINNINKVRAVLRSKRVLEYLKLVRRLADLPEYDRLWVMLLVDAWYIMNKNQRFMDLEVPVSWMERHAPEYLK